MSLDKLEQALFEAKWGDAEEDGIDVVARMFELSREAVERVLFAASIVRKKQKYTQLVQHMDDGPALDSELREAIKAHVERGFHRAMVRFAIQNNAALYVRARKLIGKDTGRICDGCPFSIDCVVNDISTPPKCAKSGPPQEVRQDPHDEHKYQLFHYTNGGAQVRPQRIQGDAVTVTCEHPRGTWTIDVMDVLP